MSNWKKARFKTYKEIIETLNDWRDYNPSYKNWGKEVLIKEANEKNYSVRINYGIESTLHGKELFILLSNKEENLI